MHAKDVVVALNEYANPDDAVFLQRFFKTGQGQYGEGDVFIGVRVPDTRRVCAKFRGLPVDEIKKLLESEVHEHRLAAVILLADAYKKGDQDERQSVYECYLQAVYDGRINNWDIVDTSAEFIIGEYLRDKPKRLLERLAVSPDIWQRRVAVLSTFAYIKTGDGEVTLRLAEKLLRDPQDLIQKAVGWMLREVGKRCDESLLRAFLDAHAHEMPRTMLRYAIERLDPASRKKYMGMKGT
jgi:3-methyladenine DNA glycosylase AlkD